MKPQFSIVVPVYNAEFTLRQALDSISQQLYRHFEVILVNDGSTDNSAEIIKNWKASNPDIAAVVIDQYNRGLGNARNQGIARASHAWLALLDADDLWKPEKLQLIAEAIEQLPADIYYHPVKTFGLSKSRVRPCHTINDLSDILTKGNPILPSAVVGKTHLFRKYQFSENPDFHGAEDLHLWITMLTEGVVFEKIDQVLADYRETGGMSTALEEHVEKVKNVLGHFYRREYFTPLIYTEAKRRKYLEMARFHHKRKNFDLAGGYYGKAKNYSLKVLGLRVLNFLRFPA